MNLSAVEKKKLSTLKYTKILVKISVFEKRHIFHEGKEITVCISFLDILGSINNTYKKSHSYLVLVLRYAYFFQNWHFN